MIQEPGTVVATDEQFIWVETVRTSACQSCSARAGCGQAVLGQLLDERQQAQKNLMKMPRLNEQQPAQVGDQVSVGIPEDALIKASFMAYGLPILLMVVLAGIFNAISNSELIVIFAGVLGLAFGLAITRWYSRRWACEFRFHPRIIESVKSVKVE